ncbi:MAG: tetratricopeptide repeat protein, partial [Candidatus Sericytochromatia bacterium]
CYFYTNKNDEAVKNLSLAIKVDEKNVNARFNLGVVYKAQGKKAEAKNEWLEMMKHLKTDDEKKMLQAKIDELEKM